ncbi:hypothetical protein CEXT_350751 [Caerostris extrusa]|uniref:Uncharacterized protein n=1 Tax=Caerostris extrusa TaxID=172846 RepID=A0AAV4VVV6_CAEEX|nr:hypothetical protein CEXT_350751 [Caerostris extrusa]
MKNTIKYCLRKSFHVTAPQLCVVGRTPEKLPLVQQANKVIWVRRRRRLESARRSRQKPEVKLSVNGGCRNAWKKLQRRIRAEPPSLNPFPSTIFQSAKKFRADPFKREHENVLRRERRVKKRQQTSNGPSLSSKRHRLDNGLLLQCIMITIFLILNPFEIRIRSISSNPFLTVQSIDVSVEIDYGSINP